MDLAQNVLTVAEECACGIPSLGRGEETQSEGERMCDIYGKETLARSRLFTGTGARVQRMLEKAQRERRALKVGILGGSGMGLFISLSGFQLIRAQYRHVMRHIRRLNIHRETRLDLDVIPHCSSNGWIQDFRCRRTSSTV